MWEASPTDSMTSISGGQLRSSGRSQNAGHKPFPLGNLARISKYPYNCENTGWLLMSVSFLPVLRLYRLGGWRAPVLPGIALLYAAMTADSARRHYAGRGGEWKGRTVPAGRQAQ